MKKLVIFFLLLGIAACSGQNSFKGIASGVLGSTGLVSEGEANALFTAGEKFAKAATPLTAEQEYYLGRSVSASILGKYKLVQNQELQRYVNKVGMSVVSFSDTIDTFGGYHFGVVDSPELNAMAAPGGFIFVTSGMMKIIPDEDTLAAVLAHEIGHVALGHGVNAISEANITSALVGLGKEAAASRGGYGVSELTSVFGDSVSDVVNTVLVKGYSRSQEYDADRYAYAVMKQSAFDPGALGGLLKTIEKIEGSGKAGGWMSTHPKAEDRIDELSDEGYSEATASAGVNQASKSVRTQRFLAIKKHV